MDLWGPGRLRSAVVENDVLLVQILSFASLGTLQLLSMANKRWLDRAYSLSSEVAVDMDAWPFARTELGKTLKVQNQIRVGGQLWTNPMILKDSKVRDADLLLALKRFRPTQLARLAASSSCLSSSSVSRALTSFSHLRELSLSSCGSGKLGAEVQASLDLCTCLKNLHLDSVQLKPPRSAGLSELIVGRTVMQDLWPLDYFQHLRVLNLSEWAFVNKDLCATNHVSTQNLQVHDWLLETFKRCRALQEIQIYAVTQVTNEMLAVLIENLADLWKFAGFRRHPFFFSRFVEFPFPDGARSLHAGCLSAEATAAFEAYFPAASIMIDDIYAENLNLVDLADLGLTLDMLL